MPENESSQTNMATNGATAINLNILETIQANRFNGESGLDVHAFIQEIEGRVSSMGIVQGDIFDGNCLNLAKSRMDLSASVLPALMASFNGAPASQRTWPKLKQELLLAFSKEETDADLILVEITLQRPPSFSESDIRLFIYKLRSQIHRWAQATGSDFPIMQRHCLEEETYTHTTKSLVMLVLNASLPTRELRHKITPKLRANTIDKFPNIIAKAMRNIDTHSPHIAVAATHTNTPPKTPLTTQHQITASNSLVRPYTNKNNRQTNTRNRNNKQRPFQKQYANQQNNQQQTGYTPNKQASRQQFQDYLHKNIKQTKYTPQPSNNTANTLANPNFFPHRGQCFKCLNDGHSARYCTNTPFCPYHEIPGHCFADCKDFAHLAARLLNRMGPKAQIALQSNNTNVAFSWHRRNHKQRGASGFSAPRIVRESHINVKQSTNNSNASNSKKKAQSTSTNQAFQHNQRSNNQRISPRKKAAINAQPVTHPRGNPATEPETSGRAGTKRQTAMSRMHDQTFAHTDDAQTTCVQTDSDAIPLANLSHGAARLNEPNKSSMLPLSYAISDLAMACFGESSRTKDHFFNAPILKHEINGSVANFFVDTGSSICIISLEALDHFHFPGTVKPSSVVIKGLGGTLSVVGSINLELAIGCTKIYQDFIVVKKQSSIPGDILLGYSWLAAANIFVHPMSHSLFIEGERFQLCTPSTAWLPSHPQMTNSRRYKTHKHTNEHLAYTASTQHDTQITLPQFFPDNMLTFTTLISDKQVLTQHGNKQSEHRDRNTTTPYQQHDITTATDTYTRNTTQHTKTTPHATSYNTHNESPRKQAHSMNATSLSQHDVTSHKHAHSTNATSQSQHDVTSPIHIHETKSQQHGTTTQNDTTLHDTAQHQPNIINANMHTTDHDQAEECAQDSKFTLYSAVKITVPPFSSQQVPAKASIRINGKKQYSGHILTHPAFVLRKSITTTPGLHVLEKNRTAIHIVNTSPKPINFFKGTPITTCEFAHPNLEIVEAPLPCPHTPSNVNSQDAVTAAALAIAPDATSTSSAISAALLAIKEKNPPNNVNHIKYIEELFKEFPSVLPTEERPLGKTSLVQHSIELKENVTPVRLPVYRLPHKKRQHLLKEIEGMEKLDLIEASQSPWSSPLLLVPKSDGSYRAVVDYRQLNSKTIPHAFPIPSIKSILHEIRRESTIFSSIDLAKGFLQVPLDEDSRPLTAFSTPHGHFQFKVAPMGLSNSPLTFCRLMSLVLQGIMDDNLLVYMDDILIVSGTVEDHCKKLREVFDRLKSANLTINPSKCSLFQDKLVFLGHTISKDGIRPNSAKISAVVDFPQPKNQKNIKQFLGLTGFYRAFVPNYGDIANPLTSLLKKGAIFNWSDAQEQSFRQLKHHLTCPPTLVYPNYDETFHLYTDASNIGLGAVLMQSIKGKMHPIAFGSRKLSKSELNYHVTDKEFLAVVWGLTHFEEIILGYEVIIHTDHNPITTTLDPTFKDPHGRKARWILTLNKFNAKLKHIKGTENTPPDALSRSPLTDTSPTKLEDPANTDAFPPSFAHAKATQKTCEVATCLPLLPTIGPKTTAINDSELRNDLEKDPIYGPILSAIRNSTTMPKAQGVPTKDLIEKDGLLYRVSKPKRIRNRKTVKHTTLVLPESYINNVLVNAHEGTGHFGFYKTLVLVRSKYFFPKLLQRVRDHVNSCKTCHESKGSKPKPATCGSYPTAKWPWQRVAADVLSLPQSQSGAKYLLVFIDEFSRFTEIVQIPDKSARTVARSFFETIICRHGCPSIFITDNDPAMAGEVIQQLCKNFNISKPNILPFRPQANGGVERVNKTIISVVRTLCDPHKSSWCQNIPAIQAAINGTYHTSLGDTPHYLLYGVDKRMPEDLFHNQLHPLNTGDIPENLTRDTQKAFKEARRQLIHIRSKLLSKKPLNNIPPPPLHSLVYHLKPATGNIRNKLDRPWHGPLRIIGKRTNQARCFDPSNGSEKWYHIDTLKSVPDSMIPYTT